MHNALYLYFSTSLTFTNTMVYKIIKGYNINIIFKEFGITDHGEAGEGGVINFHTYII